MILDLQPSAAVTNILARTLTLTDSSCRARGDDATRALIKSVANPRMTSFDMSFPAVEAYTSRMRWFDLYGAINRHRPYT
jgi:hypothetical protein